MKKLVLIRHAEAEPETSSINDFDRKLTSAGKKDAAKMAAMLLNNTPVLEIIISSPAARALETAHIFAATFGFDDVKTEPKIYEASAETLLCIINLFEDKYDVVHLVGHNPGVSNLLYKLTTEITTMPTSAWVEVALEADSWAEISADSGILLQYQFPYKL